MEIVFPWLIGTSVLLILVIILLAILFSLRANEGKQLEKLVKIRTNELDKYQRELETALETSKAASRSKSVFLANMSHEIRTPMNSIVGFSELALDDDISEKTKDYLKNICINANWLLQIINDILDISKIESGKMELENIPFDMHELFASCKTLVMPKAAEKGILLHFYAEPSVGKKPVGDPTRLRQVFVNLLTNAVKFTNTGIVKLVSDITNIDDNSISIHFEIKDSGIGLTPEQIEVIFDPFAQAETGTTRKYGGTGLGLSITKNIIEMMGGKLIVESTLGIGSRFCFDLTFETINITEEELTARKTVLSDIKKPAFEGEVLLCEDNVMNQQVICEHLARVGLRTIIAENGKVGVEMVNSRRKNRQKQFDLIFMDIHMPVMDGLEASVEIFKYDANIPIVAMTANIMSDDREVYESSGISDCLSKPFTSQELWRCLLKYLTPADEDNKNDKTYDSDLEFHESLLKYFLSTNQNKYEEIRKALENSDIKLAHRLAHSLKSNAGQIGKQQLYSAAARIEHHLAEGINSVTMEHMISLKTELDNILKEIKNYE